MKISPEIDSLPWVYIDVLGIDCLCVEIKSRAGIMPSAPNTELYTQNTAKSSKEFFKYIRILKAKIITAQVYICISWLFNRETVLEDFYTLSLFLIFSAPAAELGVTESFPLMSSLSHFFGIDTIHIIKYGAYNFGLEYLDMLILECQSASRVLFSKSLWVLLVSCSWPVCFVYSSLKSGSILYVTVRIVGLDLCMASRLVIGPDKPQNIGK